MLGGRRSGSSIATAAWHPRPAVPSAKDGKRAWPTQTSRTRASESVNARVYSCREERVQPPGTPTATCRASRPAGGTRTAWMRACPRRGAHVRSGRAGVLRRASSRSLSSAIRSAPRPAARSQLVRCRPSATPGLAAVSASSSSARLNRTFLLHLVGRTLSSRREPSSPFGTGMFAIVDTVGARGSTRVNSSAAALYRAIALRERGTRGPATRRY